MPEDDPLPTTVAEALAEAGALRARLAALEARVTQARPKDLRELAALAKSDPDRFNDEWERHEYDPLYGRPRRTGALSADELAAIGRPGGSGIHPDRINADWQNVQAELARRAQAKKETR